MVDTNKSLIVIILDRSGSMLSIRDDTIGGVNAFLQEQQKLPGECLFTLIQFDDVYEIIYQNIPIKEAKYLDQKTFVPRGSTALLDAMGRTIDMVGDELSKMQESQRPGKVFIVTYTDGAENASQNFNLNKVNTMIRKQREDYKWEFIFLAANQDAIATASLMGISADSSMTCSSNAAGTYGAYNALSKKLGTSRSSNVSVSFDAQDRADSNI